MLSRECQARESVSCCSNSHPHHVDRGVPWMLRSRDDGEAGRVNCSSRVEHCAVGNERSIKDGIVSSILG